MQQSVKSKLPVRIFFTDLGDQESTHTSTGTSTKGVGDLETLQAVARFGFLTDNVKDGVYQLSTFGVVALGPVVTSTGLSKDKVILERMDKGVRTCKRKRRAKNEG